MAIKKIVLITVLVFLGLLCGVLYTKEKPETKGNSTNYIYGKWQCKRCEYWKYSKYTEDQVKQIMDSTLHIDKDRIYFDKIEFIDAHSFLESEIKVTKIFDEKYQYADMVHVEKCPLSRIYTEEQLNKFDKIELGNSGYGLGILYFYEGNLIIDRCGGLTLFMEKVTD